MLQWVLTAFVLAPVLLIAYLELHQTARDELRHDVLIRSQSLLNVYRAGGSAAVARSIDERLAGFQSSDKAYLLIDDRGRKLAGNLTQWPAGAPVPAEEVTARIQREGNARPERACMRTLQLPTGEKLLVGSIALATTAEQSILLAAILVGLLLLLPVVPIVSSLQHRYLRKEITQISRAASTFAGGDLTCRINVANTSDECAALATILNRTFDRLEFLVEDLVFVTDVLAHELRSPLSRLRAEFEKLEFAGGDGTRSARRISAEIEGMLRTVNATLELSRAEAEGTSHFERTDAGDLVRDIWEVYEASADQTGVALVLGTCDRCACMGNRDLLAQAISNLLDNALRHSNATRIEIGCVHQTSHCSLFVSDNGIGIPEQDRKEALRKFGRLDRARTKSGSGLGLTFVDVIAGVHGGDLLLSGNTPGLRAAIRLPAIAESTTPVATTA